MLDLVGPLEIFAGANAFLQQFERAGGPFYRIEVVTGNGRPVRASNGMLVAADRSMQRGAQSADTLVVPGALEIDPALADHELIAWIRRVAVNARRVASVCSGAFLLAKAGLLDGRRATTHWAGCDRLARLFPRVTVEPDPIFVRDGNVTTSAGVTSGMDLALALVEEDLGPRRALELARWFVMFVKRPGGQSQFSSQLRAQMAASPQLQALLGWVAEHPSGDLSVEALAKRMHLSPRHFARVFREEIGITPAAYVLDARLEHARRALEESRHGLKTIAMHAGFGSDESLRRAFHARLGITPGDYRDRFQRVPAAETRRGS
jgi:transcriptional regulator GlxA family with amidase domain